MSQWYVPGTQELTLRYLSQGEPSAKHSDATAWNNTMPSTKWVSCPKDVSMGESASQLVCCTVVWAREEMSSPVLSPCQLQQARDLDLAS